MSNSFSFDAVRAIAAVIEAECPLCASSLRIDDGRGCCPCCGDSYIVSDNRLELRRCVEHGKDREHWKAVWARRMGPESSS